MYCLIIKIDPFASGTCNYIVVVAIITVVVAVVVAVAVAVA